MNDEDIVLGVLTGLTRLAAYARDSAAAGGNSTVHAQVVVPTAGSPDVGLYYNRGPIPGREQWGSNLEQGVAETVVNLDDLAEAGPALIAATAALTDQIAQMFGLPDLPQVNSEGQLRARYWNRGVQPPLTAWANEHGIDLVQETVS